MKRFVLLLGLIVPLPAHSYSVLTHEAIIDSVWRDALRPALVKRFPNASEDQLREAHAYAYGGCIIQDLGYYPFAKRFFSDLTHYVRSADFVQALIDESQDLDQFAFALGAVAHYGADIEGHAIAVNRSVAILFPRLRRKFGPVVTYGDDPATHLKTEFGFDVLQVARGHYAPQAYHDFIGFEVSKDVLDRAFQRTYGLKLEDVFHSLDLTLGTYRFTVSKMLPGITRTAWALKSDEIRQAQPTISRRQFLYNIKRASFKKQWGHEYQKPGFGTRLLAAMIRILPKVGPLRGLAFKVPTAQTEKMFEDSFDASVSRDRGSFAQAAQGALPLANRDLDTGKAVSPGEYALTDRTYDELVEMLAKKNFGGMTPELKANILDFYGQMKTPDQRVGSLVAQLKAHP